MLAELAFDGRAVVVTGAGQGIGQAAAEILAELGARVYALDKNAESVGALAAALPNVVPVVADVTSEADAAALRARIEADGARLKALVNNVGTNRHATVEELTLDQWNALFEINLTSMFLLSRALIPLLLEAEGGGAIVNVSSGYGLIGAPNVPAYAATKAGVIGFTRQIAVDYQARGLRANVVCPGLTLSPRVRGYVEGGLVDAEANRLRVLGRRFAECREIGNVIAFLASDAASYMTGAVVPVDGGQTAS